MSLRLQVYLKSTEDARQCDHIRLGLQQQLIFCHPLRFFQWLIYTTGYFLFLFRFPKLIIYVKQFSPGSWFFLPLGTRVYNKLVAFIKTEYWRRGYTEVFPTSHFTIWFKCGRRVAKLLPWSWQVISPNMFNMKLWETSGHAANAKENMYTFDVRVQCIAQQSSCSKDAIF